jgi:hypothetical protein
MKEGKKLVTGRGLVIVAVITFLSLLGSGQLASFNLDPYGTIGEGFGKFFAFFSIYLIIKWGNRSFSKKRVKEYKKKIKDDEDL